MCVMLAPVAEEKELASEQDKKLPTSLVTVSVEANPVSHFIRTDFSLKPFFFFCCSIFSSKYKP